MLFITRECNTFYYDAIRYIWFMSGVFDFQRRTKLPGAWHGSKRWLKERMAKLFEITPSQDSSVTLERTLTSGTTSWRQGQIWLGLFLNRTRWKTLEQMQRKSRAWLLRMMTKCKVIIIRIQTWLLRRLLITIFIGRPDYGGKGKRRCPGDKGGAKDQHHSARVNPEIGILCSSIFRISSGKYWTLTPKGLAEAAQPGSTTQPKSETHLLCLAVITFLGGIFYIQVSCHFSVIH